MCRFINAKYISTHYALGMLIHVCARQRALAFTTRERQKNICKNIWMRHTFVLDVGERDFCICWKLCEWNWNWFKTAVCRSMSKKKKHCSRAFFFSNIKICAYNWVCCLRSIARNEERLLTKPMLQVKLDSIDNN